MAVFSVCKSVRILAVLSVCKSVGILAVLSVCKSVGIGFKPNNDPVGNCMFNTTRILMNYLSIYT